MKKISVRIVVFFVSCLLLSALSANNDNKTVNLLLTAENEPWLLPIVAPLSAHLQKKQVTVPFLSIIPANEQNVALTSRISKTNTFLLATKNHKLSSQAIHLAGRVMILPAQKTQASLQIAQQFWRSSHHLVGAWIDDNKSIIMGATLATHYGVPFLYFSNDLSTKEWKKQLDKLKVKKITLINSQSSSKKLGLNKDYQVINLSSTYVTRLLVRQLGQNLKNILLARIPINDIDENIGENIWLVPYISFLRKSLPLLLNTSDPDQVEQQVTQLIQKYKLKPSTITLLGDSSAIGLYNYQIGNIPMDNEPYSLETAFNTQSEFSSIDNYEYGYEYESEPVNSESYYELSGEILTYPQDDLALSFGVGRIPFNQLYQTATLFVRGLYREQQQQHRVLMVANPLEEDMHGEYLGLPLCETISRATSQELHNFSVKVDEFYRQTPNNQTMIDVSKNADMIIFQGHSTDQHLLENPEDFFQLEMFNTLRMNSNLMRFNHLPIIILQSCNSLDDQKAYSLLELGGVALIGSVSSIHSASGSSFIKTLIDRTLYEGETLGTALRDARNYFFVLQDLKNQRRHRQQAKSLRVALSFRLWGDPQLKVFKPLPTPKKQSLSVVWETPNTLTITTPSKRLPKIETEKYIAYGYPGVEYAGLVKKLKNKSARKLIPLYFVKIHLPGPVEKYQFLTVLKGKADRLAYRIDPQAKQLYLLYLTQKEKEYPTLRFQFSKE